MFSNKKIFQETSQDILITFNYLEDLFSLSSIHVTSRDIIFLSGINKNREFVDRKWFIGAKCIS